MLGMGSGRWEGIDGIADDLLMEHMMVAFALMVDIGVFYSNELKITLAGQRSGKRYTVPGTSVKYTASRPGEAPASRLGNLRLSAGFKRPWWEGPMITVEVGIGLGVRPDGANAANPESYAPVLEYGGKKIARRPYMEPTAIRVEGPIDLMMRGWLG